MCACFSVADSNDLMGKLKVEWASFEGWKPKRTMIV